MAFKCATVPLKADSASHARWSFDVKSHESLHVLRLVHNGMRHGLTVCYAAGFVFVRTCVPLCRL